MQVDAVAALAPVLARFAIVVDGPLEAEVLGRLVTGGNQATTLADLARPFPGRPEVSRPEAVAIARGLVTRLLAGGSVEHVGGGYRIADPALAAHLRAVVDAVGGVAPAGVAGRVPVVVPPGGAPAAVAPLGGATVVAPEEAARMRQQVLAARSSALPAPVAARAAPPLPGSWQGLVAAGWTTTNAAGSLGASLVSSGATPVLARIVVADPTSPPAAAAARLGALGPTHLAHVPAPPVTWGQGDPTAVRATAAAFGQVLGQALGGAPPTRVPVVVDRALAPAVAVLATGGGAPDVVIVDLRSGGGVVAPSVPAPAAGPVEPSVLAAAMAGAAGVRAPWRRRPPARGRTGGDLASLLEVLFGPRCAAELAEELSEDLDAAPADPSVGLPAGLVVTARTDDPQADALGALLGVEVLHLDARADLLPEVLAWLEDDDGRTLLAPRA